MSLEGFGFNGGEKKLNTTLRNIFLNFFLEGVKSIFM